MHLWRTCGKATQITYPTLVHLNQGSLTPARMGRLPSSLGQLKHLEPKAKHELHYPRDRPLESRPPDESLPPQRRRRRQFARGAVRGGLQHPLVAADDRQKRAGPFFTSVAGRGFDRFKRFAAQITRNLHRKPEQFRFDELGDGLKVDFSGTTKECRRWRGKWTQASTCWRGTSAS